MRNPTVTSDVVSKRTFQEAFNEDLALYPIHGCTAGSGLFCAELRDSEWIQKACAMAIFSSHRLGGVARRAYTRLIS